MNTLLGLVKNACEHLANKEIGEFLNISKEIESITDGNNKISNDELDAFCKDILCDYSDSYEVQIYVYSVWTTISKRERNFIDFVDFLKSNELSYQEKYFAFTQLKAWMFWYPERFNTSKTIKELTAFLLHIVEMIQVEIPDELLAPIESEMVNNDLVVFFTSQFLSERHGPTKHALDHAMSLMRKLKKKVFIINTAEGINNCGLYVNKMFVPRYWSDLCNYEIVKWENMDIPFFQCDKMMPNTEEIIILLKTIRKLRPRMVVEIGSGSVLSALVEKFLPVLTNGTLHSAIEVSGTYYQTISRAITDEEKKMLRSLGRDEDSMIYSMFTTKINRKDGVITRNDLNVNEGSFLVAIVGGRLYLEIDDNFIEMLKKVIDNNRKICFIFFGDLGTYESLMESNEEYKNNILYYGFTDNTLGCLEQCDLYLNPYRAGGGMSAIEAMAAGIPAVSMPFGDAGVVLGNEFWIDTMDEASDLIIKYSKDTEYYKSQAEKALKRGEYLQDSDTLFIDTLHEFEKRVSSKCKL